ncbi:MAG: DUF1499 domain-containing protein [Paracoccaceae bacterium]|jgi:hypothetical protein|nr:DUF1499 domain-containing protein [Paracoccaceae bacterium]
MIRIALIILVVLVVGVAAWVRLAPVPADRWHKTTAGKAVGDWSETGGFEAVRQIPDPQARLAELGRIVAATPRTALLEGSAEEGLITFVTRSAVWGFPDITNLWIEGDRVHVRGHLIFGRSDLGVNRDRILGWLGRAGL